MRHRLLTPLAALFAFLVLCGPVLAEPHTGDDFPPNEFPAPQSRAQAEYLGVAPDKAFSLDRVKGKYALVQVFSMYCPVCQRDAGNMNELFAIIQQKGLRSKLKVLAVGAGNSPFEIEVYRKKYEPAFPLFPDPDYKFHKCVGEVGTPYFWLVTLERKPRVLLAWKGEILNAENFFEQLRQAGHL